MRFPHGRVPAVAAWLVLLAGCTGTTPPGELELEAKADPRRLECDVAIVGGGAGGLHTAYRLAPELGKGVCLFEKDAELGGRIRDLPMNPQDPSSPRFGVGARRVMEGQEVLFGLAEELGLELETPETGSDLINARGAFSLSKEALTGLYPGMTMHGDPDIDQESFLYDVLRFGSEREHAGGYADFPTYVRSVVGQDGYWYLHDMSRFRGDFEYSLDARGYLDWLDEEWDVCCTASYPRGGMSAFIFGMEREAAADGARIYKSDPVARIDRVPSGYRLNTANHVVFAKKLVIAVPPDGMKWIGGAVAEAIKAQPEFQQLVGVRVVTITQWWPEAWWAQIRDAADPSAAPVWRAWTTEHCMNFIEIPLESYAASQKVTRSVYDDDAACVAFWEDLAKQGTAAVEAEIEKGLLHMFAANGVTAPALTDLPDPVRTHVQVWPAAWYWLKAGSPFTNADIQAWAVEPLPGEPVGLVGEGYNPQRSGWSDGAYKSSIRLLAEKY